MTPDCPACNYHDLAEVVIVNVGPKLACINCGWEGDYDDLAEWGQP